MTRPRRYSPGLAARKKPPTTMVAFVLVKKLYVRQTLGEQTEVPGEDR